MRITNILFQLGNYSDHHKEIHQTGKYILHIEAKGYDPKMVMVDIPKMYKNKVQKELNPVYLRKKPKKLEVMLDEVVVTATKLRFYMDGDTCFMPMPTTSTTTIRQGLTANGRH